jgi:PDDEXK-like domain of unknown function (DUF3799)
MSTLQPTAEYRTLSNEEYHRLDGAISNSMLKAFRECRKDYHAAYVAKTQPKDEPSDAMVLGTLAHMAVLEPERWISETIAGPVCDRRTTAGKKAYAEFLENSNGKTIVTAAQYDQVMAMREAVYANETAMSWLNMDGEVEQSLYWTDEETRMPCKRRTDKRAGLAILDLKFVTPKYGKGIDPEAFAGICKSFGYHQQAAWYLAGERAVASVDPPFVFIGCSTKEPHEIACYELDTESIGLGFAQNRRSLMDLADCLNTGDWRAPHEKRTTLLGLPKYSFSGDYQ